MHLDRGAHHGRRVHLAVARLQAVERAALDGELEVLHLAVVPLEAVAQVHELRVDRRHLHRQVGDRLRRADARHHVLALRVGQVLAVDLVLAGGRVAREAHARGAVVAHVAEHHGDDVHRRAVRHGGRDLEFAAVVDGALAHPRVEHRLDGDLELLVRVGREGPAGVLLHDLQEPFADVAQVVGTEHHVLLDADAGLHGLELLVERGIGHAERHLAEQLDETPPRVVAEALVAGVADERGERGLVEAEVEDRVHHARHGHGRAGAHRDQQRVVAAAELLAGLLLEGPHVGAHLVHRPSGRRRWASSR